MGGGIGRILKLSGNKASRCGSGQLIGLFDGAGHALVAGGQNNLGTVGLEQIAALQAHGFGHSQDDAIAAGGGQGSQTDAGVAAGGFNDDCTGGKFTLLLRGVQHGLGHAVLDAAGRIEILQLGNDGGLEPLGGRVS